MDLPALREAIASKSYDKIANLCDDLLLQVAAEGVNFQEEWPYAIHLLDHIYLNDVTMLGFCGNQYLRLSRKLSRRLLQLERLVSISGNVTMLVCMRPFVDMNGNPEVEGLVMALSENYAIRIFQLLTSAYSTISIADTAHFLAMRKEDVTNYALQHGWSVDPAASMFTDKKQPIVKEQKLDPSKLQHLTQYVFHLEH